MKLYTSFHFAKPALDLLTTRNRFVLPTTEDQCSLPNEKEKKNQKEKERRKREMKVVTLCLETRTRSEGYMAKDFKARCPKPSLVGSHQLSVRYTGGWVEFSEL